LKNDPRKNLLVNSRMVRRPQHREFGFFLLGIALLTFAIAAIGAARSAHPHLRTLIARIGAARIMLLAGIIGTWLFMTVAFAAAAWLVARPPPINTATAMVTNNSDKAGPLGRQLGHGRRAR
jgi:hypothetical protein